jgi:serine protease Do
VECKAFDEQVVRRDPEIAELMDQFVSVRLVQANAMDLTLFQFDYDLTFAVFFMNADKTVYGRFGSRSSQKDAAREISIESFRQAMPAALELHKNYPANKAALAGKRGPQPKFKAPEEYPSLRGKYRPTLDYEGKVVQSCMHCHQVRDAERVLYRTEGKAIPDEVLYPWPMPDVIGLALDPKEKAKVKAITPGSSAEKDGFRVGDEILTLKGQPILSIADVQWVLHNTNGPTKLKADVLRGGQRLTLNVTLAEGWRRQSDIAWRATSWELRRMATGGLLLKELPTANRQQAGLADRELALLVEHVGEYGEHAAAKRAGFQKKDLILSVDGQTRRMSESELFGYLLQNRMPGAKVPVGVLRGEQRLDLELPMQ